MSWTPGPRRVPAGTNPRRFHESPAMTGHIGYLQMVTYDATYEQQQDRSFANQEDMGEEGGNTILLSVRWLTKAGVLINLSEMSEEELDMFEVFMVESIAMARPTCQRRDAIAREAEANGDYRHARSNRADPKMVRATRKEP